MKTLLLLILAVISTLPNSQAFFVYRGSFSSTPGSWVKNSLKIHHPSLRRPPHAIVKHVDVDGSHPQQPVVNANAVLLFANALQQVDLDGKPELISNDPHSNVIVRVEERNLPISPFKAKEAWNKFVWRDSTKRMILWPFWLQEEQQRGNNKDNGDDKQEDIFKIHSQLVNSEALQLELLPQHTPPQSLVSFAPCSTAIGGDVSPSNNSSCCHLTWQVQLAAKHPQVVHAVASFLMTSTVNDWMDAIIATPRLLHHRVVISNVAVDMVVNAWLDFVWIQGGGMPLRSAVGTRTRTH